MSTNQSAFAFARKPAGSLGFHKAATYQLDRNVRKCALLLENTELLGKLAPGDMTAQEAEYHTKCLFALYTKAMPSTMDQQTADEDRLHGIAFAELVVFMEDINSYDISPTFKLTDLAQLYKLRLEQLGVKLDKHVHTTRLLS